MNKPLTDIQSNLDTNPIIKSNKENKMNKPKNVYRHGEVSLIEVKEAPKGLFNKVKSFILAHSETGHNHVLEAKKVSDLEIYENNGEVFVKVNNPVALKHQKTFDAHRTLEVAPGLYKRYEMNEYSPFTKIIESVKD
jgi:hypothetical protein